MSENGHKNASRGEVLIGSEQGAQRSTNDSVIRRSSKITAKEMGRNREEHGNHSIQSIIIGNLLSQELNMQGLIDIEKRNKEKGKERQRRYREKKRMSTITLQNQLSVLDKDKRKKELARERQQRFRERRRKNFTEQQEECTQSLRAEQNATISQVQNYLDFEEVKMDFSEETAAGQCTETNTIYIKQEFEDGDPLTIPNNGASTNTKCNSSAMELTEPAFTETVGNDTVIDIKQESPDVPSSTSRHDFVFVACADAVILNETTIRNSQKQCARPCPYCGKHCRQLDMHKMVCEGKFVYFCIFCPAMLKRRCNIKRHITMKHSREIDSASQHLNSVDKVFQEIVAKRKELNINAPEERNQAIVELMNANKVAKIQVHKQICIVTENQQELIIPDPIEAHQESIADTKTSNAPFEMMKQTTEMPTLVQNQNIEVYNSTETTGQQVIVADSSQKSNFSIVVERLNTPTVINMQDQCVTTKKAKAIIHKRHYVYCNECVYKSTKKIRLQNHITRYHSDKLNLKWHECNKCGKKFQYLEHLKAHIHTCKERAYYYCPFCSKYMLFKNMSKHVLSQHPKEIKNTEYDDIKNLLVVKKEAVSTATNKKTGIAKCKTKIAVSKSEYICDECHYKTPRKDTLIRHIGRIHSAKLNRQSHNVTYKERAYYCPFCPKSMLFESMLKHVLSQHPKEIENNEYDDIKNLLVAKKEAVEISKATNKKAEIEKCKPKIAVAKSEYFCDECDYKTTRKHHLIRHIGRIHFATLNLQSKCSKRKQFMKKKDLETHSDEIMTLFKYTCIFCPLLYARLRSVKHHILQKHSSELLEKPINDVMKEIDAKKTIGHVAKPSKQENFKYPEIDPCKLDASTLEYVSVYCFKCKHVKVSFGKAGHRLKNCQDCGTRIIYLCSKCKEMHSLQFNLLANHWKQCTKDNKDLQPELDKLKVYSCSECSYEGTHKAKFKSHLVRSKHKAAEVKNAEENKNNENDNEDLEMYNEAKFAIQRCVTDYTTMTRRYCSKCDKVITEDIQQRKCVTNENCQICGTRFHLQCVKCNLNYKSFASVRYHLNSKCFPGDYKCIKCGKHACNWQSMQKHYVNSHTNHKEAFLCEFCSFRSKHRTNFYQHYKTMHPEQSTNIVPYNILLKKRDIDYACDLCDFTSKRKGCLKVHLQNVHGKKRHKCKICKFKTRYEASLKRHYFIRHQNYY